MPRTSALEHPGCPPLGALSFDELGLIKVVEARGERGIPTVVERWGEPNSKRRVVAASLEGCQTNPRLAVARKNGLIEVLNSINGEVQASVEVSEVGPSGLVSEDNLVVGLHIFKPEKFSSSKLLTCTTKGSASIQSVHLDKLPNPSGSESPKIWNVCGAGKVLCSAVDSSENYSLFGGKGIEINVWDLNESSKIWTAKSPPRNSLGIFSPSWFTAATYLTDDHRKIVTGTNNHQVRLYDISAQRRPVVSFDFRETPIKAVTVDSDGHTIYVGNACGDLASFDMRTGKLLGCFVGKCCGSIRSIARHPELPVIASCGLDSYLRFWDTKTRKPLSAVFLKQQLTRVILDANFTDEELPISKGNQARTVDQVDGEDKERELSSKRMLSSVEREQSMRRFPKKSKTRGNS